MRYLNALTFVVLGGLLMSTPVSAQCEPHQALITCESPNGGFSVDGGPMTVLNQGQSTCIDVAPWGSTVSLWSCGCGGDPACCGFYHYTMYGGESWAIVETVAPEIVMVQQDKPWSYREPMPDTRSVQGAVVVDGKIWVVDGDPAGATGVYDPRTDSWTTAAPLPVLREVAGIATVGGKIYAIGGHRWGGYLTDNAVYDPGTDSWIPRTPMPTARSADGTAALGGLIYVIGGYTHATLQQDTVEAYDPATDSWSAKAPMPTARSGLTVVAVNGKIYAIGGDTQSGPSNAVEEYDPATDRWTVKTPLHRSASGMIGAALNGKLHLFGGWYSTANDEYDPATDSWVSRTPMPGGWCVYGRAVAANGVVHVFGGTGGCPANQNLVYQPTGTPRGGVWTTVGPEGAQVDEIAADPTTPGTLYAATLAGLFKSTDAGTTWERRHGTTPDSFPQTLARAVAVGGDGKVYVAAQAHGMFWSEDGGDSWFQPDSGFPTSLYSAEIAVDLSPPFMTVYAGVSSNLYRSDDGGRNWILANGTAPNALGGSPSHIVVQGSTVFVGTSQREIWASPDGGANWFPAMGIPPNDLPVAYIRGMAEGPGGALYVALSEGGVFRTDDSGASWQAVNGVPPNDLPVGSLNFWARALAVDDSDNLYLGGPDGIYKGTSGGQTWAPMTMPVDPIAIYDLTIDPTNPARLFAGADAGVLRSEDSGVTCTLEVSGMRGFRAQQIVMDSGNTASLYASGYSGVARSMDSGSSWGDVSELLATRYNPELAIYPSDASVPEHRLYAVSNGWTTGVARRDAGDPSWSYPTLDVGVFGPDGYGLHRVAVHPADRDRVFVAQIGEPAYVAWGVSPGGVFRSDDAGATWTHLYQPSSPQDPDPQAMWIYQPESLLIDPINPDFMYLSVIFARLDNTYGWHVMRSTDGGVVWNEVRAGTGFSFPYLTLAPDDTVTGGAGSAVYLHIPYKLFRSTDGGTTWDQLPDTPSRTNALAPDPLLPGTLYAIFADRTIRMSRDRGESWESLSMVGFDSYVGWGLAVAPTTPRLIHAGGGGGVYTYETLGAQTQRPEDTTRPGVFPATVTFAHAFTPGDTSLTAVNDTPTLPFDVSPGLAGLIYDIETTVLYAEGIEVCIDYDPADYAWPEEDLKLYRYDEPGGFWQDVTSYVDAASDRVCGDVSELSYFAVVEPREQPDLGIPVRWCGVAGAPSIEDPSLVGETTVNGVLLSRQTRTTDNIFLPQTGLIFRSATTAAAPTFPVLTDPNTAIGAPGDVHVDYVAGNYDEFYELIQLCRDAWTAADPTVVGLTAVQINQFVDASGTPINLLGIGGVPGEGNCSEQMVGGRAMVIDGTYRPGDTIENVLGHELGHGLSLHHGDGIDNDGNGILDDEGDPLDGFNLMQYQDTGDILTTAQGTRMRNQALSCIPDVTVAGSAPSAGSQGSDPLADAGTPGWADLLDMGLFIGLGQTEIYNGTASPMPTNGETEFRNYVDLDDDPITGGGPASLGFPTAGAGVELVTATTVTTIDGVRNATTSVWIWDGADFVPQTDPGIQTTSSALTVGLFQDLSGPLAPIHDPPIGEAVVVSIPSVLLPPVVATPTIETQTTDVPSGTTDNGAAQLDLNPPVFAEVTTTPGTAGPGEALTVTASGLPPDSPVQILLGTETVATGTTDGNGEVTLTFTIPMDVTGGERLITAAVLADDVAVTGVGSVVIPTAPTFDVPPTPSRGSTQVTTDGETVSWTVQASDADVNDVVTLEAVNLPPGATFVATSGNPASGDFAWTPSSSDGGTWGVTFEATDDRGSAAPSTTLQVEVVTNRAPVALCRDVTVSTDAGVCFAALVSVDADSVDPDDDPLVYDQNPPGPYGLGSTAVTLTVTDDSGLWDSCAATVTVLDTEPPAVTPPADLTLECNTTGGVPLSDPDVQGWLAAATATDNCGLAGWGNDAPGFFPLGGTTVTFSALDSSGNAQAAAASVVVGDTVPPTIHSVAATPDVLWPPNHKLREVQFTVVATDICDPDPTIVLQSVISSEPDDAEGKHDGKTSDDIQQVESNTADFTMLLRAERSGNGPGRTYTATYAAADDSGNSSSASGYVTVPHDQGGVVEPVMLEVHGGESTTVTWNEIPDALGFDVVRGDLSNLVVGESSVSLGPVVCVEGASEDNSTVGHEDPGRPSSGTVFFYLVAARYPALNTFYGTESAVKNRLVEAGVGECP